MNMSAAHACTILRQFESHLADLYELYSAELTGDPEVSALFARLAGEERSHALEAGFQAHIVESDPNVFGEVHLDTDELLRGSAMIMRAQAVAHGTKADEALRTALELEQSAAELHGRMAVRQANPGFGEFLAHLGQDDSDHRARLARVAESRQRKPAI
jgi:rubrerythrin